MGFRLTVRHKVVLGVLAVVGLVVGALGLHPLAGAQPVGNPGNINFTIIGGSVHAGLQFIDLTPNPLPECSDGVNNDDGQDTLIDYPADPECTSPLDDSEVEPGFQPKQATTITGTVTGAGVITIPQSGIFFPPSYVYQDGGIITAQLQPTTTGSGTINPLTGKVTLTITLKLSITGTVSGNDLGSSCAITPFTLALTSGTTAPPAPNSPITGVGYDQTSASATLVDNSFSMPAATNCGPLGAASGPLSAAFGVPAAAGTNTAILVVQSSPVVSKGVVASNVPSTNSGNAPLTVNFNGTGSTAAKSIASYAWDFGNGQTATGPTAFTTYSTPGTYSAKLTVTDTDGDKDTQTQTIIVSPPPNIPPTAAIGASGSGGQVPYAVSFDGTGSSDPDGSIVSYAWDFGNGRTASTPTASATYFSPGTYHVTLTVTDDDGATGTASKDIVVTGAPNQPPTAVIKTLSVAGTIPLTVNLSGASSSDPDGSIASYAWDLGNGQTATGPSVQAIYNEAGSYTVTLTVTDNGGATSTQTLTIDVSEDSNIPPSADFTATPTSGSAPLAVSFDGSASDDVDGTVASYAWNFGNGQNGTGATPPPVTYTLPGTYTATLTVTDNKGAAGTVSQTITVNPPPNQVPTANVTATPSTGNAPLLVQLSSAGSVDPDGAITGYAWNFGNGQTSTSPNPSATYNSAGAYTVTLTVTDNQGATSVKSTTVTVNPANQPPVPAIVATPLSGSAPLLVKVNGASSSDPDGSVVSYAWDFGNGQTATGPLAQVTYASQGTYVIRLTVTDNRGAQRSTTTTVVAGAVNQRPIAVLTALPTSGPAPLLVSLSSTGSHDPDGSIVSYAWDFGNGQTATGTETQVTYPVAGSYTVTLTVTDNKGATATDTDTIVVQPPAPLTDRVRLQLTGALSYAYDGPVNGTGLRISRDAFGVTSVTGSATYTGPGNSTATVSVNLSRFLIFNAFSGTVTVKDTQNGVNTTTNLLLTPLNSPSSTSVRGTGTGTVSSHNYTLNFTIDDRA